MMVCMSIFAFRILNVSAEKYADTPLHYEVSNGEITITYCDEMATGEIVIPNTIEGYPVTSIGFSVFGGCDRLTSVTIPDSVVGISEGAFFNPSTSGCSSLTSINVDVNNNNYCSDNGILYNKAKTKIICYPSGKAGTNFTIPNSVTSIGRYAFFECGNVNKWSQS